MVLREHGSVRLVLPSGAPAVELEPRPHTIPPSQVAFLRVGKEQLLEMNEHELANFAWQHLGIALDYSWPKAKMLGKLLSMSSQIINA